MKAFIFSARSVWEGLQTQLKVLNLTQVTEFRQNQTNVYWVYTMLKYTV